MLQKSFLTTCLGLVCALAATSALHAKDEKVKLEECPPAVQKAIQEHAAGGKIGKVERATEEKAAVYEAEVKTKDGNEMEVMVTPDGRLVQTEYKVKLTACPAGVQKAVAEKSAAGTVKTVEKVVAAKGKVTYTVEVKPAKGEIMELEVTEAGKVLKYEADKD